MAALNRWKKHESLAAVDAELIRRGMRSGFNWYLNSVGQIMVIVRPPVATGDGLDGQDTENNEPLVRPFVVAATETIWKEFLTVIASKEHLQGVIDDNEPVRGLSWFDAAEYCVALSYREGMGDKLSLTVVNTPPDENAMIDPSRVGYRPPSVDEWRHRQAGAGSRTERFFGSLSTPFAIAYHRSSSR